MKVGDIGWQARLPFYFGWVIVAISFVTMAVSISIRTSFSLLLPPLIDEFGWDRALAAGAFSFGFIVSAFLPPVIGRIMDRRGPRPVVLTGVALLATGLLLAPTIQSPWQLYATLGLLVGAGSTMMGFTAQSLFLPLWFERRRGLAISIAFSGVGAGAIVFLPLVQSIIETHGWRVACQAMGALALGILVPLNLLLRHRPQEIGLLPDGAPEDARQGGRRSATLIVDEDWAGKEWTLARAMRTARFWWILVGFFCALHAWYAVQVHQTRYLIEIGYAPGVAAWALGAVSVVGIPGQIGFGALSDRIGREPVWAIGCMGFALSYGCLMMMAQTPTSGWLWTMVLTQGFFGYALTSVMGAIVAEIFEGPHFGAIFGVQSVAIILGAAAGPWVTGALFDITGSYRSAWLLAIGCCIVSAMSIWIAAPRKVRAVSGSRRPAG